MNTVVKIRSPKQEEPREVVGRIRVGRFELWTFGDGKVWMSNGWEAMEVAEPSLERHVGVFFNREF